MIELLIGPYRSGKTGRVLSQLVDHKLKHPLDECLILVPSHRYGRMLRRQLLEIVQAQGAQGLFGVHIATIYQACRQIINGAGLTVNVLPRELCVKAISETLHKMHNAGELTHLNSIYDLGGTADAVSRLVEEFERAALTPNDVLRAVQTTAADSSRQQEFATIYKKYWERLDELNGLDQKRLALYCRELLARKQVPGLHLRWLVVDGFDRISALQAEVIEGIAHHTAETRIAFDYVLPEQREELDPQDDEYSWKDTSYNELHKRFNITPMTIGWPGQGTRPRQFGFSTLDPLAEIQETARRCKEAIVVRGIKPEQILVVARNIENYASTIKLSFNQAGLPFFIDEAIELMSTPYIKAVRELTALAHNDFRRRQVIDLLRSRYIDIARLDFNPADVDRLDRITRKERTQVVGGREQWRIALRDNAELLDKLERFFDLVTPPAVQTAGRYCHWLESLLDMATADLSASAHPAKTKGGRKCLTADECELQALKGLRNALRTLMTEEALFGKTEVPYGAFLTKLEKLLESANFRRSEPHAEYIHVCSAEHAPNRRYDEVFLVGLTEGQFPKHSGESGFTSADERSRWALFGVNLTNPREEVGFEKALFRSLIDRARRSFWASHPQVDLSGDEVIPSFYLNDGTLNHGSVEKVDFSRRALLQPAAAREAVFGWLWGKSGFELADRFLAQSEIDDYWQHISGSVFGTAQRHDTQVDSNYNGQLSALVESGWLQYKLPNAWSASALNTYGQCPFRYWVSEMLDVERLEEPEPGLDTKERGRLFHRILELYYSKAIAAKKLTETEVNGELLTQALNEAFEQQESNPLFDGGPYWDNEKREIAFRVNRFLQYDLERMAKLPGIEPALLESRFGMLHESGVQPLTCDTPRGPINIRGIIDRIDVERAPDGKITAATVIDYKSGSTPVTVDDARAGANMQIPIYALAVQQRILTGVPVRAGHYLSVLSAKSIGSINFEKDTHADLMQVAQQKIAAAVDGIASGDFPVAPYSSKACTHCDHRTVCRIADLKTLPEGA